MSCTSCHFVYEWCELLCMFLPSCANVLVRDTGLQDTQGKKQKNKNVVVRVT